MQLRARLVVEGFMVGLHKSPYHGFSVEFAEHRPYMPGDSLRNLDWKVYAKTDRFYVKQYEEETNLKAYLLLDVSNSMNFGTTGLTKFQYSTYLAAALSFLMIQQRDAVGLCTYDTGIRSYLPPRSVRTYLNVLLSEMERTQPSSRTDIGRNLHAVADRITRRGLVIVLSDLLDDPTAILSGLKHFRHEGHEMLVFHVLDPRELDFAYSGDVRFRDLETEEEMPTHPWHLRKEYRQLVAGFVGELTRGCREHRIDYHLLNTQTSFDEALVRFLTKRRRLR
ncbi:DUF58 domain-containing protein [bacterium]|nr:DUF58 domain-containing protein [bacterium]MBU1985438.1 DUF58 domain-containing protein [bacterium]